ncbi:MAG: hypothetical protein H7268_00265, partial [Sandarakinorhabdus sp.]|nr:hypothetical protein [Sandarakinorhabdus sp.]
MTPAESERQFDELMRRKLATDEVQPSAALWPAVSATLPPPTARLPWRPVGAAGFLGVLIGVMMGWWTGPGAPEKGRFQRSKATGVEMKTVGSEMKTVGSEMKTVGSEKKTVGSEMKTAGVEKKTVGSEKTIAGVEKKTIGSGKTIAGSKTTIAGGGQHPVSAGAAASATAGAVVVGVAGSSSAAPLPITLWQTALAQDSAIRREAARSVAPVQPDSSSRVLALIVTQRATLRVLQRQLDTLKAALPAEPAALPVVAAVPAAIDSAASADSAARTAPALLPARRWAVALLTDATTPWGALPT